MHFAPLLQLTFLQIENMGRTGLISSIYHISLHGWECEIVENILFSLVYRDFESKYPKRVLKKV